MIMLPVQLTLPVSNTNPVLVIFNFTTIYKSTDTLPLFQADWITVTRYLLVSRRKPRRDLCSSAVNQNREEKKNTSVQF